MTQEVSIRHGRSVLAGDLAAADGARAAVLFAHGSGSSRHSVRNRYVAQVLVEVGMSTLLMDLLTENEERVDLATGKYRFDIALLAERVVAATDWLASDDRTAGLPIGYFGASTGAAAALVAAAQRPDEIFAIVSRGGRPDMARQELGRVKAPTLLVVGGNDIQVIEMNRSALGQLAAEKRLVIVPGATHLFPEPGALEEVGRLAAEWFANHLPPGAARSA